MPAINRTWYSKGQSANLIISAHSQLRGFFKEECLYHGNFQNLEFIQPFQMKAAITLPRMGGLQIKFIENVLNCRTLLSRDCRKVQTETGWRITGELLLNIPLKPRGIRNLREAGREEVRGVQRNVYTQNLPRLKIFILLLEMFNLIYLWQSCQQWSVVAVVWWPGVTVCVCCW